ncbi:uncharacterized protein LOC120347232 [Styela clava]
MRSSVIVVIWIICYVIVVITSLVEGLICYECWNAKNDEDCRRKGKVRLCEKSQTACQTTERVDYAWGPITKITKNCKQARACQNNFRQNKRKRNNSQCRYFKNQSVCRCCCIDDLCNFDSDTCTGVTDAKLLRENSPKCPKIRRLRNGVVSCDRNNNPGSNCRFRCKKFHDLHGPGMLRCEMDKLEATWSDKMPCCSKPCPPHGNMDLVFAVDSSIESEENWEKIKELLKDLITTFLVGPRESRIGIVTYNEKVGADSEIFLNSYNSTMQLASAVNTLRSHPGPTRGTRIGQLLDHVNRVSFLKSNGNRRRYRDILVMLTTGAPLKEKLDPKTTAKLLRDNGIDVVTVGVGSYVDMKQLRGTAGFKKRLIEIPGGAQTIGESKFKDRIINIICGETCERR